MWPLAGGYAPAGMSSPAPAPPPSTPPPANQPALRVTPTPIPGLLEVDLDVRGDERGWFKESYQRAKLEPLGVPPFEIVQNNFSYNAERGVTRGLHAEPWEKYVSLANGRVFGAWVDLRRGASFGVTFTLELTPAKAVFVPRGVANGYQTLDVGVTYTYLVNEHWSPDARYSSVNLWDPEVGIPWPIRREAAVVSDKDRAHPPLAEVEPFDIEPLDVEPFDSEPADGEPFDSGPDGVGPAAAPRPVPPDR